MLVQHEIPVEDEIEKLSKAAAPAPSGMRARKGLRALGRLKPGQMNKAEAAYARHLEQQKALGIVQWFAFEAVTLKIAPDCRLTVDFMVIDVNGFLCAHDVKGSPRIITDDAKVKMRVAADRFPFRFFYAFPRRVKDGGGWDLQEVAA